MMEEEKKRERKENLKISGERMHFGSRKLTQQKLLQEMNPFVQH